MSETHNNQTGNDKPAEELPDITMTDGGEKEPGEDPDFDDSEIENGSDNRS